VRQYQWKGVPYLIHSLGDELALLNASNPAYPFENDKTEVHGELGNTGDAEYEISHYAVCSDCRYGFLFHTQGQAFFEINDTYPQNAHFDKVYVHHYYQGDYLSIAAFVTTFKHNGQQYLIGRISPKSGGASPEIPGVTCPSSNQSVLYKLSGLDYPDDFEALQCITLSGNHSVRLGVGEKIGNYFYAAGEGPEPRSGLQIRVFEIIDDGGDIRLEHRLSPQVMRAKSSGYPTGMALSPSKKTLATANRDGISIWNVEDPSTPQLIADYKTPGRNPGLGEIFAGTSDAMAIYGAAHNGPGTAEYLQLRTIVFDRETGDLQDISGDFWSPEHAWNDPGCLTTVTAAAFSPDGTYSYLSRWEVLQAFKVLFE
jgi:hypothetical protein